jgi:hypothetical protein
MKRIIILLIVLVLTNLNIFAIDIIKNNGTSATIDFPKLNTSNDYIISIEYLVFGVKPVSSIFLGVPLTITLLSLIILFDT